MQSAYGKSRKNLKTEQNLSFEDDDYENLSGINKTPAVPSRETKGIKPSARTEDIELKQNVYFKGLNTQDAPKFQPPPIGLNTQDAPKFQPPPIGLDFSSLSVDAAFRDFTDTDSPKEENPKTRGCGRLMLVLMVLLILMFVLFLIVTSLMYIHLSQSKEVSKKERDSLKGEMRDLNHTFVKGQDSLMSQIKTIKSALGICSFCPPNWKLIGYSCYFFSTHQQNWENSQDDCIKRGSNLAIINHRREQNALQPSFGNQRFWIGLKKDSSKVWKWVDESIPSFTKWSPNEPNNEGGKENCAEIFHGSWNDLDCTIRNPYICEGVPDC